MRSKPLVIVTSPSEVFPLQSVEHLPGVSCRAEVQRREVSLIGYHAVKARMPLIVEAQIAGNRNRNACIQ